MGSHQEPRLSPIERLSVEVVQMILVAIPNVQSLDAAVRSSPLFYRTFLPVQSDITRAILLMEIDASVVPEAITASASSRLPAQDAATEDEEYELITDFAQEYIYHRQAIPSSWSLKEALRLTRLHSYVEDLANRFATTTLAEVPSDLSTQIPTHQELYRIQRTLYRFEIWCNFFSVCSKARNDELRRDRSLFFDAFAPWENEQLGCVNDFLARLVLPAFNDVSENDADWGLFRVEYGESVYSSYIQYILSLGLAKVHQVATAETYEERHRLMDEENAPLRLDCFLCVALEDANMNNDSVILTSASPGNQDLHIKRPFFIDLDSGPEDAWRWALEGESWAYWIYHRKQHYPRQWGYVMWDRSRLAEIGIFEET